MRTNPHILEINTRSWLKRLEKQYGRPVMLNTVPDAYWNKVKNAGFDAVWLMGVWKLSPAAEKIARENADVQEQVRRVKPDFSVEDITASPYAVYEYTVDESLGGNEALAELHAYLNARGICLLLDFVGNHTAIDSPTVNSDPDLYINTGTNEPHIHKDWFFKNANGVFIAHGRDPYFAPWTDTAQLNYFNPKTREFMLQNLERVSQLCDGVRCDMAMLSLNKVTRDTWWEFIGGNLPKEEFWKQALTRIRAVKPEFVFIAEVYWGLEWDIQELGFDYTYDKTLYDRLRFSNAESIRAHLGAEHLFQMRSLRFIANHDEEDSLKAFGRQKSLAAGTIIATLPGARLFHLFQLLGRPARMPIQFVRDDFPQDKEVEDFYWHLLQVSSAPAFHGGQWNLKDVSSIGFGDNSNKNILAWQWKQMNTCKLIVINYSDQIAKGRVCLKGMQGELLREELSSTEQLLSPEVKAGGLEVELQPYESKIFTYGI